MTIIEDQHFTPNQPPAFKAASRYENCRFDNLDFTMHSLADNAFMDCHFTECQFPNQKLLNTSLRNVRFEACNLLGINWTVLKSMQDVIFLTCKLDFGIFQECDLKNITMKDCTALEADFSDADLTSANLSGTDFSRATFSRTRLAGADFRLSRGYVFDLRTTSIAKTRFSLPDIAPLLIALGAEVEL